MFDVNAITLIQLCEMGFAKGSSDVMIKGDRKPAMKLHSSVYELHPDLPTIDPANSKRMIYEVMQNGFLERHVPTIRALYKAQRNAMLESLALHFPSSGNPDNDLTWNTPAGGMFLWARLPEGMKAVDLLPIAVDQGVAFVPGAPFYAGVADPRTMRLSFVTPSVEEIHRGVAALAQAIAQHRGA